MTTLHKLADFGQSPWLDFISRSSIRGGQIAGMLDQDILGVTSNPAIFAAAITGSDDYDEDMKALAAQGLDSEQIYDKLSQMDVQEACDLLRPIYDRTEGVDGYVSLEVSPNLANDTETTISEARRLWKEVDRPNLMVKVPATKEGIPAIRQLIADGININVTLLFSLERYRMTADAYIAGLEERAAKGLDLKVASVASFFVSRIDSMVDPLLKDAGRADLVGEAATAWSILSYKIWQEMFGGDRFAPLSAKGARSQRVLWASTSTKDPSFSPVKYVEALIGPETVNTLPLPTIEAYLEMGDPADRVEASFANAESVVSQTSAAGVDLEECALKLEDEGVAKFVEPYGKLLDSIEQKRSVIAG
jgi:transaldolase